MYAVICYNRMGEYSKKEDNSVSLQQLKQALNEWQIRERILEKIDIWGIRYTAKKINNIPTNFISYSILYYFLNRLRNCISSYTQPQFMNISYHLRCIYNSLAINQFKSTSFFEFSLIILAKLTHYFITSRFSQLVDIIGQDDIEKDVYRSIVQLLIGYQVDSKAYEILQKKYKLKRENSLDRKDSFKIMNQLKVSVESNEKNKSSTRKLHRNGIKNLLQNNDCEKNLETFRLEVHQALHIKKGGQRNDSKASPKIRKKQNTNPIDESTSSAGWMKGKNKLLNINQVSAAMSIYIGTDNHNRANIHLSKRRQMKEYYFGINKKERPLQRLTMPLCDAGANSTKNKDWSLIVESMKQKSAHVVIKEQNRVLKKYHLFQRYEPNIGTGLRVNQITIDTIEDNDDKIEDDIDFRKLRNAQDQTIHCINNQIITKKQPLRKSSSTFFVRDRGQFQKSCAKRKELYQNSSYYLPKIDK